MSVASSVGLMSGLNYEEIITQLTQINSRQLSITYNKQQRIYQKQSAMQAVNKAVLAFSDATNALKDPETFSQVSSYSSKNSVVAVSADNSATPGQYSVSVHQVAQAHRVASQGFETIDNTPIAATSGQFEYRTGDASLVSIDIDATTTLQDLRDRINSQDDATVTASIINDGTATNSYRLILTSSQEGSENAISFGTNDSLLKVDQSFIEEAVAVEGNQFNGTISSSGTYTGTTTHNVIVEMTTAGDVGAAMYKVSLDGGLTWTDNDAFTTSATPVDVTGTDAEGVMVQFDPATIDPASFAVGDRFTIDAFAPEIKEAQDAMIEVDGIRVTRSSNTFDDVIDGVSLEAKMVDEEEQTIKVVSEQVKVQEKVKEFIDAYNGLHDLISEYTNYDVENQSAAPLFGDSSVNMILASMRSMVTDSVDTNDGYSLLSEIGITVGDNSRLVLDTALLSEAVQDNSDQIMRLFSESAVSSSSTIQLVASTENTLSGDYTVEVTTPAEQAQVTGGNTLGPGGLALSETLMIVDTDDNTLSITLEAGSSMAAIVDQLNSAFVDRSMGLRASEEDGQLIVATSEYGSEQEMRINSNRAAGDANQLGIGTTMVESTGVDVIGKINGREITGEGQTLKGLTSTPTEGLELLITAKSPMTSKLDFTRGIALNLSQKIEAYTDSDGGLFAIRDESYANQIEDYNKQLESAQDRIDAEEQRMRQQFQSLELKLASLQSQGSYLQAQLASLVG